MVRLILLARFNRRFSRLRLGGHIVAHLVLGEKVACVAANVGQQVIIGNLGGEMAVGCYIVVATSRVGVLNAEVAARHLKVVSVAIERNTALATALCGRFNTDIDMEFGILVQRQTNGDVAASGREVAADCIERLLIDLASGGEAFYLADVKTEVFGKLLREPCGIVHSFLLGGEHIAVTLMELARVACIGFVVAQQSQLLIDSL